MSDLRSTSEVSKTVKQRDSNIELYRIISMLFIVAHHYVVNSGLVDTDGVIFSDVTSWRSIFLLLFGAWGKIGINCFMMITGYFMCKSHITIKKFVKLLGQIYFYKIGIYLIFLITGYEKFSVSELLKIVYPIYKIEQNFTSCFIMFFLCIPFLNILVQNMNEKQHRNLLILMSVIYVIPGTILMFNVSMNYVSWFAVLYFIASYIRMYPKAIHSNTVFWGIASLAAIIISAASVVICTVLPTKFGMNPLPFIFVTDSNNLLALITGVATFMFFKNLKIGYSKIINNIAATTFGVLLIHASSNTMRRWLWSDVLENVEMYSSKYIVLHAVGSVIGIFIVCSVIDMLRIRFLEKPFMAFWDKKLAPKFDKKV